MPDRNYVRFVLFGIFLLNTLVAKREVLGQATPIASPRVATPSEHDSDWISSQLDSLEKLYRHFHQHPELSFEEVGTARRFAAELSAVGATVTSDVGGNGVVAVLRHGAGPTVMLRADLDGLPVRVANHCQSRD